MITSNYQFPIIFIFILRYVHLCHRVSPLHESLHFKTPTIGPLNILSQPCKPFLSSWLTARLSFLWSYGPLWPDLCLHICFDLPFLAFIAHENLLLPDLLSFRLQKEKYSPACCVFYAFCNVCAPFYEYSSLAPPLSNIKECFKTQFRCFHLQGHYPIFKQFSISPSNLSLWYIYIRISLWFSHCVKFNNS